MNKNKGTGINVFISYKPIVLYIYKLISLLLLLFSHLKNIDARTFICVI